MSEVITANIELWTSALLTKATGRRGANIKHDAYGIKKLRELILELSVRGKLVPQDTNDEPARALLERIAKEKSGIRNGGAAKKLLPGVSDAEKPHDLPDGWEWTRFGNIAQHNSGKTLDRGRNTGQLRDYITTSNLYWGRFELSGIRQMRIADEELEKCTARRGDLLICEGGEAGRAAVWPYDYEVCFQNHVHRARFFGDIDPNYFYRFFEKLNATGEIEQYRKGVGISSMSSKSLSLIVVPVPPLAEQRRIVAKVDELMALCDQLEEQQVLGLETHQLLVKNLLETLTRVEFSELDDAWARIAGNFDMLLTTEHSVTQLKETILQLAVMGRLVPQVPDEEPAATLLERMGEEKAALMRAKGIKKQKAVAPIVDASLPFDLPQSWAWERLGNLAVQITDGTHHTPTYVEEGVPFISVKDLDGRTVSFEDCKYISQKEHEEINARCNPEHGDLLLCRIGTLGRATIVDTMQPFSLFVSVGLIKFVQALFIPEFTHIVLHSPLLLEQYEEIKAEGSHTDKLNLGDLPELLIPVPPLEEQRRIVAKVEELMAICDAMKTRIQDLQRTQAHLADAVVERALA